MFFIYVIQFSFQNHILIFYFIFHKLITMAGQQQLQDQSSQKAAPVQDLRNGAVPWAQRQCRDVYCCILFIINVIAMIYASVQGYVNGVPSDIYRATDSLGNACGQSGTTTENYPYSYFYYPFDASLSYRVCVKSCPVSTGSGITSLQCLSGVNCTYSISINSDGSLASFPTGVSFVGYDTQSFLDRICIPSSTVLNNALSAYSSNFSNALSQGIIADFITDITNNWYYLIMGVGLAVIISFTFMFTLRCTTGIIVWGSLFGILFILLALGILFLFNAGMLGDLTYYGSYGLPSLGASDYYQYYAYVSFGAAAIFFILMLCCCSRIRLAVAVYSCAGKFISRVCQIMLVPVFQGFLIIIMWAACLIAMVYLISSANFQVVSGDVFTSITDYTQSNLMWFYYFIFATLWSNALLGAITIFVIANSCVQWYYSHGPGQSLESPVLKSYLMIFRFHLGSLAFGAFILAVVQFLQFVVQLVKKHIEAQGMSNQVVQYIMNCLRCVMACIEKIVEFINKTAYIQIAISGKNFCMAAADGFAIVISNAMRYAIVTGIGEIVMLIGKIMITLATGFIFYMIITFVTEISENILEPLLMLLVVCVIAFAVSMVFMSVYSVAADTLLACFITDQNVQIARGGTKAAYAPQQLADLMQTSAI